MKKIIALVIGLVISGSGVTFGGVAGQAKEELPSYAPLTPLSTAWDFNEYWRPGPRGSRDFYFANGNSCNYFINPTNSQCPPVYKTTGFYNKLIPGLFGLGAFSAKASKREKELANVYLQNRWPFMSCNYSNTKPADYLTEECFSAAGDLWIGDGHPEELYRQEPFLDFARTGELGTWGDTLGSQSMAIKEITQWFKERLVPVLDKQMPFWRDVNHEWTPAEWTRLFTIASDVRWERDKNMTIAYALHPRGYIEASRPQNRTVGTKNGIAEYYAYIRGMARQFGGGKFVLDWIGYEPSARFTDFFCGNTMQGAIGYPFAMLRQICFSPYLRGANMMLFEAEPYWQQADNKGQALPNVFGEVVKELFDFSERHPVRGVVYSPVAILEDWNWVLTGPAGKAQDMRTGLIGTQGAIYQGHHSCYPSPNPYVGLAPHGELFDVLRPNVPGRAVDAKALANYKVLFLMGGFEIEKDLATALMEQVSKGGVLVIQAEDIGGRFPESFTGVKVSGEKEPVTDVICLADGRTFTEQPFTVNKLSLDGAKALFEGAGKVPIVTRHDYKQGYVIVINAGYMVQDEEVRKVAGEGPAWVGRPALNFVGHFLDHLTAGLTPIEVRRPEWAQKDISYQVSKKGENWLVTIFNYSLEREALRAEIRNYSVEAIYPPKQIPVEIVCRLPTKDVAEWFDDREVSWQMKEGAAVVSESIPGGSMRVYEFSPKAIDFGTRKALVNYALNRPCKASSFNKGNDPGQAVDGVQDNFENGWWSEKPSWAGMPLPQWLEVDLGEVKTINHVGIKFYYWPNETMEMIHHVHQYIVEVSEDGKQYKKVVDMSNNVTLTLKYGKNHWFDEVKARYVKVTVLLNSAGDGARIMELEVTGPEEGVMPIKKQGLPVGPPPFPMDVSGIPSEKTVYLADLKPAKAEAGWIFTGKKWADMTGQDVVFEARTERAHSYSRCIYAHANSEIVYRLDGKYKLFLAYGGLGNHEPASSVRFRVIVDGVEKLKSEIITMKDRPVPVCVNVSGAQELNLQVADAGDGIAGDYAWWGEARLVKP